MCVTAIDEALMASLGIDSEAELDLETAGATVERVLAALAGEAVSLRTDVRIDGVAATTEERRVLFELLAAGLAKKNRTGAWLTRRGRAFSRTEGVSLHAQR